MAEKIANVLGAADGTITTLAVAISSTGATTITTAGAAPSGLHSGEFRVRIDNEIMRVTSGQNGTGWTVERGAEGTTAATHASGASVRHILTAGAVAQMATQDARFPTSDQKGALAGTAGAPSAANPLVTDADARLAEQYVWDADAEEYVLVEEPVRIFLGPVSPADAGFTMRDADTWDSSVAEA